MIKVRLGMSTKALLTQIKPMWIGHRSICFDPPVALNGFGQLAKLITRKSFGEDGLNIVAINQPCSDVKSMAHLLKHDAVHGKYDKEVQVFGDRCLKIHGKMVRIFHEECPENIDWVGVQAEYVIDTSGKFTTKDCAMKHISSGAKKVIITGPNNQIPMFVKGVNYNDYKKCMQVVSSASHTANCAGPLVKALNDKFGVESVTMNTMYAQKRLNDEGLNYRMGMTEMIPSTTGAAVTLGVMLPELQGRVMGYAARFPVALLQLSLKICPDDVTINDIKNEIMCQSNTDLSGVLSYAEGCMGTPTFIGCQYSGIVDFGSMKMTNKFLKLDMWYDSEMGYASRVVDLVKHMKEIDSTN